MRLRYRRRMTKYLISFPSGVMQVADGEWEQVSDHAHTIIEVPTRAEAVEWARRVAVACRCPQELREFMHDPES